MRGTRTRARWPSRWEGGKNNFKCQSWGATCRSHRRRLGTRPTHIHRHNPIPKCALPLPHQHGPGSWRGVLLLSFPHTQTHNRDSTSLPPLSQDQDHPVRLAVVRNRNRGRRRNCHPLQMIDNLGDLNVMMTTYQEEVEVEAVLVEVDVGVRELKEEKV